MLRKEDIEHLAVLARIRISEEEKQELAGKLDAVLAYVSEIGKVSTEAATKPEAGELRNVMREDGEPRAGGAYQGAILGNAPDQEDKYVKVRQIL